MPIENERKYLIKPTFRQFLNNFEGVHRVETIEQHYLGPGARIRRVESDLFFTFKKMTKAGLCEIETIIDYSDFVILREVADSGIYKVRKTVMMEGRWWEIDDFGDFMIAEIEIYKGEEFPAFPHILRDYLIMNVSTMPEFTNQALSVNRKPALAAVKQAGQPA